MCSIILLLYVYIIIYICILAYTAHMCISRLPLLVQLDQLLRHSGRGQHAHISE